MKNTDLNLYSIRKNVSAFYKTSSFYAGTILTSAIFASSFPVSFPAVVSTAFAADLQGNAGGQSFSVIGDNLHYSAAGGFGNGYGGGAGCEPGYCFAVPGNPAADGVGGDGASTAYSIGGAGGKVGNYDGDFSSGDDVIGQNGGDATPLSAADQEQLSDGRGAGGGGGGAGAVLTSTSSLAEFQFIKGGHGGAGAASNGKDHWGGGAGGGGGAGVILRGATFTNDGIVRGGDGGDSGEADRFDGAGAGGDGIVVEKNSTFINYGTAWGGGGGQAASAMSNDPQGHGGSGIRIGESAYVINAGRVRPGDTYVFDPNAKELKLEVDSRSNAIDIVGDHSTLELWDISDIQGNVVVADGVKDATLVLGGAFDASFNADELGKKYRNFENFKKTGSSKWNLTGKTDTHTPWTINDGVLSIGQDSSLGDAAGVLTIAGGTLQTRGSFDIDRELILGGKGGTVDTNGNTNTIKSVVSGEGSLTKDGDGALILTKENTFTGEAKIAKGELRLSGEGSIASADRVVNNGTLDISGVSGDSSTIRSLKGEENSKVEIGDKTLIIDNPQNDIFAGVIDGNGGLSIGRGGQILLGNNTYTGDTTVALGGELQLGNDERVGAITSNVINNGILSGNGSLNDLVNRGSVVPGTSKGFGTLTVNGNYTGENGQLVMKAALGDDNSKADRLVVTGNTSGTTEVVVLNRGGLGAQTNNGIKLIEVGGKSDGQFNLRGDYVNSNNEQAVVAGAYAYTLNKGSSSSAEDGNWYLRSENKNGKNVPDGGQDNTGGNGNGNGNGNDKAYQVGVPIYAGINPVIANINRTGFASVRSRLNSGNGIGEANAGGNTNQDNLFREKYIWGRISSGYSRLAPAGNVAGAVYGSTNWTVQAGVDGKFVDDGNGELFGSVWFNYNNSSVKTRSDIGDGKIVVDGYGLGGALTWSGENGFYIDGQGKATWYKSGLESDRVSEALADAVKSFGYALSLEAGQKFKLSGNWSVTPQAQLIWSSLRTRDYVDVFSASVATPDNNALTGRLGIAANYDQSWQETDGTNTKLGLGGIANIYQDLKSGANYVTVADIDVATGKVDQTWGELGLTANYSWQDEAYSVFGNVSAATSLQNAGKSYSVNGNVGFKVKW